MNLTFQKCETHCYKYLEIQDYGPIEHDYHIGRWDYNSLQLARHFKDVFCDFAGDLCEDITCPLTGKEYKVKNFKWVSCHKKIIGLPLIEITTTSPGKMTLIKCFSKLSGF